MVAMQRALTFQSCKMAREKTAGGGGGREQKGNASRQAAVKWEQFFELAASEGC